MDKADGNSSESPKKGIKRGTHHPQGRTVIARFAYEAASTDFSFAVFLEGIQTPTRY
jgi:hypothetical protein